MLCISVFVMLLFIILISSVHVPSFSAGKEFILEADNNRTAENHQVLPFQNATGKKALIVQSEMPFSINFCIRQRSFVTVKNIRFLNFNQSVFITVAINNINYGTHFAVANHNKTQKFIDTGLFSGQYLHPAGWSVLHLHSDHSIALDTLTLDVNDDKMNHRLFNCDAVCIQESTFPFKLIPLVSDAAITQNSFFTKCAEVDNVDIPIYHPHVEEFSITARLPQYQTFSNRRQANLTLCPHLTPTLWIFNNFSMTPTSDVIFNEFTIMTFHNDGTNSMMVVVLFRLTGEKTGSIDTDMGSMLFLKFSNLIKTIDVQLKYKHRNGSMVSSDTKTFNASNFERMWSIPDFTWTETNYITLHVSTTKKLNVTNLSLERRPFIPDQTVALYKSDDFIIEAVSVDMWWRGHERMTIRLNDHSYEGFAFFRLYKPVPWTDGYSQAFVLYQDGNARILPVSPEGLDWIPFGTSVILGQVKRDSSRPFVSISQVDIYPDKWQLRIFFKDGGSLTMNLNMTEYRTSAHFFNIRFAHDTFMFPFVTVRSMYVEEGNTDVDSVKVNDLTTYNIMDDWGMVYGKSFAFHRRCMSTHLSLSPDIQIDILKTRK